jgi:signal transduction histidine kinase/pSer/pThr/pTyr-binding forkhead associated (FHA) protein
MFKLLIKTGEKKGKSYPIRDSVVLIGRDSSNAITLPDRHVSRKHASITSHGTEYFIEDLGSRNGTLVNDHPVQRQVLKPGDEIKVGSTVLELTSFVEKEELSEHLKDSVPQGQPTSDLDPIDGLTVQIALPPQGLDSVIASPYEAEFSSLQKAYLRLSLMYRLINDLVTVTDLRELMDRTAERVLELIKADRALIMLVDDQSAELLPQATRQRKGLKHGDEITLSKTITRRVFETGESILTSDAMTDGRFRSSDSIILQRIRSSLCVPIKTKDRILGIIHVDTLGKVMGFSQEDLELLAAMGHQIGIAVENAKLVTDLRKANMELKEQHAKLIEAEKLALLGRIAGGVAHEINNPIMSVLGFTGMAGKRLKEGMPSPEKITDCIHYLNIVQEEAQRCIQIVENISRFYRQKRTEMAPIRIQGVIEAALSVARLHMKQGHIEIVTHLSPDLPPILANQGLLQQVLVNILLNARDAMEQGGILSVATDFEDPLWVTIRISDTGCGIKPEDIQRIFTPLFTTKGEGKGTGLGLSISQDIIKSHNGAIEVESVPGKGTTFIIRLPSTNQSSSACAG